VTRVLCLDTSVWIPYLVPEVYQPQSRKLVTEALSLSINLVAPAFAWAVAEEYQSQLIHEDY